MKKTRIIYTQKQLDEAINRLREIRVQPDQPLEVSVGHYASPKSKQARNYFEATIREFALEQGYNGAAEIECVREVLLWELMPKVQLKIGRKTHTQRQSTKALNKEEFGVLIERLIAHLAQEFGYVAPPPVSGSI